MEIIYMPIGDIKEYENNNEEQVKAFRLVDNKTNEFADWDLAALNIELGEIDFDMEKFGFFELPEINIDDYLKEKAVDPDQHKEPNRIQCPHCGEWFDEP